LKNQRNLRAVMLVALAPWLFLTAHGAERITLANGFALECDHHAQVDGRMRLYLSSGDASYIEVKPEEVAGVEQTRASIPETVQIPTGMSSNDRLTETDEKQILSAAGRERNLDVDLLASVVKAESGGNAHAVSRTGARGLMQLMPATANDLGVANSFEPNENVRGGSAYLDALLTRYHENLAFALAAYNAGPLAVDRYHGIPPYRETQMYVARVIHEFNRRVKARAAHTLTDNTPAKPHTGD
jgi:hypothetical protein